MDDDVFAHGEELSVLGMEIRVMALDDVMATKFARAFFTLLEGLEILPEVTPHRSGTTVRVVSPQRSPATQGG